MNKLIGLVGEAQSGKDTLALMVKDKFQRFAFADALKSEVADMLEAVGFGVNFRDEEQKKQWRDFLVFWGCERRRMSPSYWIDQLFQDIAVRENVYHEVTENIIITDVRFSNEVDRIYKEGGTCVRLKRPGYEAINETEKVSLSLIDKSYPNMPVLVNDGSKEDLKNKFLRELK